MKSFIHLFSFSCVLALAVAARGESVEWIRQFGTSSSDRSFSISADPLGNVFISAETLGSLAGPNAGGNGNSADIVLAKYDPAGNLAWSRQFGTSSAEESRGGLVADGLGNVFISGSTKGNLSALNAGDYDVFVRKYDTAGNLLWSQQFGTNVPDSSRSASVDGLGNLYVSGHTSGSIAGANGSGPTFVRKYTTDGTLLWTTQFGDAIDAGPGPISADKLGNVFGGDFGYVYKVDSNGALLWKRTAPAYGVVADGLGSVYVSGSTYPDQAAVLTGNTDIFLGKYDSNGNLLWGKYIGGPTREEGGYVATDGQGFVYLAGNVNIPIGTTGNFQPDVFVSKFDAGGNLIWTRQMGTSSDDTIDGGISVEGHNIYASGETFGSLGGSKAGGADAFFLKIVDAAVPEPTCSALVGICAFCLPLVRKRHN